MNKLLLHCCCGPCAVGSLPLFYAAGYAVTGCFYNPNIHPYTEQQARLASFRLTMEQEGLPYLLDNAYPLETWLAAVAADPQHHCTYCYQSRLRYTAELAAEQGCEAFTTTLLISPYQQHDFLHELGNQLAAEYGVSFAYLDLRPRFREGQREARQRGLYLQKYCGCIYSEKERYLSQPAKKNKQTGEVR